MASKDDEIERLLSVSTVANLMGMSRGWVYKQIAARRITAVVELGDGKPCQRIKLSDYNAFIASRTFVSAA